MNWTAEQLRAYQMKRVGQLTPLILPVSSPPQPKSRRPSKPSFGGCSLNRTETRYLLRLEEKGLTPLVQQIKVQTGKGSWYLPDFFLPTMNMFIEVKGPHCWEDALVKFKAAAMIYPWFRWLWAQWDGTTWVETEVK